MAKKCYNCGFSDNPDNANFCGKCGNKLSFIDNWKIYNASYYCLVTKSEYDKYGLVMRGARNGDGILELWHQ